MSHKKTEFALAVPEDKWSVNSIVPKIRKGKGGYWFIEQKGGGAGPSTLLSKCFGTEDNDSFEFFLNQLGPVIDPTDDADVLTKRLNGITPILRAINPKDELEGMLAVQMIGIHDLAMKQMVSCASDNRLDAVNLKVNQITKLSRTFIAQMEALNKHRGKGKQKITVEHVTVNKGGQAIVGNVEQGGRDENKK